MENIKKLREEAELSIPAALGGRKLEEAFAYDLWVMLHNVIRHQCIISFEDDESMTSLRQVMMSIHREDQQKYGEWAYLEPELVETLINTTRNILEEFLILVDIRGLSFVRKSLGMEDE